MSIFRIGGSKQAHLLYVLIMMMIKTVRLVSITNDDSPLSGEMDKDTIKKPIIDQLNNSVVFRPIGVMYPTMTFGHLRSTIDLKKLT